MEIILFGVFRQSRIMKLGFSNVNAKNMTTGVRCIILKHISDLFPKAAPTDLITFRFQK